MDPGSFWFDGFIWVQGRFPLRVLVGLVATLLVGLSTVLARCPGPDWFEDVKNPSRGRINTHEPLSSDNTNDAALHQEVGYRKTHRRGPCPRSPNLEAAREQRPREKPCPAIALRGFQRAPGTGKLPAHYPNGPSWKTQLPTVLPHSGRGLPGPFLIRHSLGTIYCNQIQETESSRADADHTNGPGR